jgi:hypothetical protein
VKRTKKKKKRQTKKQNLKSCSACFLSAKKKDSDDDEKEKQKKLFKKESAPLENKHSLSLDVETNTPNGREKAVFSRKDKKKITDISP